jgi:hypothetical protein
MSALGRFFRRFPTYCAILSHFDLIADKDLDRRQLITEERF